MGLVVLHYTVQPLFYKVKDALRESPQENHPRESHLKESFEFNGCILVVVSRIG